jgi:Leucine-rich repeat (LRR) protein
MFFQVFIVTSNDLFEGLFEEYKPKLSALLHMRYMFDPPELFTLMTGDSDGYHIGYWYDEDPSKCQPIMVSTYARYIFKNAYLIWLRDAFCLSECGTTIWDAIESEIKRWEDNGESVSELSEQIQKYRGSKKRRVVAARKPIMTQGGIGIVVKRHQIQRDYDLIRRDSFAFKYLQEEGRDKILNRVEEALECVNKHPGNSLYLGKMLWAFYSEYRTPAYRLLGAAYHALDRSLQAKVLGLHKQILLPNVSILDKQGLYYTWKDAIANPEKVETLLLANDYKSIPKEITQMEIMKSMQVYLCPLKTLPSPLSQCQTLKYLEVSYCSLTYIPIKALPISLVRLNLDGNQIETVGNLSHLTNLANINLERNLLKTVPTSLPTSLKEMDLKGNKITSIPLSIKYLTQLKNLDLSENNLTFLPEQILFLPSTNIWLFRNPLKSLPDGLKTTDNNVRLSQEQKKLLLRN